MGKCTIITSIDRQCAHKEAYYCDEHHQLHCPVCDAEAEEAGSVIKFRRHRRVKVSVILPTFRMGGLDLTKYSLLGQTFKDFELVLVDELYDQRKDKVRDYFNGINLKHIPPFKVNNYFSSATSRNTGLLCAEGELVIFTNDYTWFSPDCIEKHWKAYSELNGKYAVTGIRINILSTLKPSNPNLLYTFSEEIKDIPFKALSDYLYRDDRHDFWEEQVLSYYRISPSFVYMDNSSIPLEIALDLNGIDTHFDGGQGCPDVNFFTRATLLGYDTLIDPENIVYEVKSPMHNGKVNLKTFEENAEYHRQNIEAIKRGETGVEADNPYIIRNLRKVFMEMNGAK